MAYDGGEVVNNNHSKHGESAELRSGEAPGTHKSPHSIWPPSQAPICDVRNPLDPRKTLRKQTERNIAF